MLAWNTLVFNRGLQLLESINTTHITTTDSFVASYEGILTKKVYTCWLLICWVNNTSLQVMVCYVVPQHLSWITLHNVPSTVR